MAEEETPEQDGAETEEEGTESEGQEEEVEKEKQYSGEKIMCFVSKQMVPIEETVELEVQEHKKVRVLPKYIKFDQEQVET